MWLTTLPHIERAVSTFLLLSLTTAVKSIAINVLTIFTYLFSDGILPDTRRSKKINVRIES